MAKLTSIPKNTLVGASGGTAFYGWLFLFTITTGGDVFNVARNNASLTSIAKS